MSEIGIEAAMIGLVASVVTALGVKLVDWIKADAKLMSVADVVEQTEKSMQAVDSWVKTYKSVEELPNDEIKLEARETALLVIRRLKRRLEVADVERTVTAAAPWLQRFLRLSPPSRVYIWMPQICFYFFVIAAVLFAAMPSHDYPIASLFAVLALLFWTSCHWFESRANAKKQPGNEKVSVEVVKPAIPQ
jgi:hypothetical protein